MNHASFKTVEKIKHNIETKMTSDTEDRYPVISNIASLQLVLVLGKGIV